MSMFHPRHLFSMKTLSMVLSVTGTLFIVGCVGSGSGSYHDSLQYMLETQWALYSTGKENWGGGAALYITSPKGSFFASTALEGGADEHIHFRIASNTKTFTAASILLLQQQGLLNIDDVITEYVPATSNYAIPYKDKITIKELLSHRAGVYDIDNNDIPDTSSEPYAGQNYIQYVQERDTTHTFTFDELLGVVALNELSFFAPNANYHYSDTGYSLLGKIVETTSGISYDAFVRDNFVVPNLLNNTSLVDQGDDQTIPEPYATGHVWSDGELTEYTHDNMSSHVAEGNIISTPADLARWIRLLMRGEAGLNGEHVAMMKDYEAVGNTASRYGLGCQFSSGLGYGHTGATPGYMSIMMYNPDDDVTIVVFASVLSADFSEEMSALGHIAREARGILGYPKE